jgi:hypothetical protein
MRLKNEFLMQPEEFARTVTKMTKSPLLSIPNTGIL